MRASKYFISLQILRFSREFIVTTNELSIFVETLLLSTKILLQIEQVSIDLLPLLQKKQWQKILNNVSS